MRLQPPRFALGVMSNAPSQIVLQRGGVVEGHGFSRATIASRKEWRLQPLAFASASCAPKPAASVVGHDFSRATIALKEEWRLQLLAFALGVMCAETSGPVW